MSAHGCGGAAVIGMAQGDDFGGAGVAAGGEDGGFVGFGAAVGEERFAQRAGGRDLGQFLAPAPPAARWRRRWRRVRSLSIWAWTLALTVVVAVADADGDDAAEEIEVLVAIGVPDVLIFGMRDDQRFLEVMEDRREEEFFLREKDFLFRHELMPLPDHRTCRGGGRGRTARSCGLRRSCPGRDRR